MKHMRERICGEVNLSFSNIEGLEQELTAYIRYDSNRRSEDRRTKESSRETRSRGQEEQGQGREGEEIKIITINQQDLRHVMGEIENPNTKTIGLGYETISELDTRNPRFQGIEVGVRIHLIHGLILPCLIQFKSL
jgi:hypothetical protein